MFIAEVIPITSSILTETLSYFSSTKITPGTLVTIHLRKKEIRGIVISTSTAKDLKQNLRNQDFRIRNILEIHKDTIFSSEYLETIHKLKKYYLLPAGKLINLTYPKYIINNFENFLRERKNTKKKSNPLNKKIFKRQLLQKEHKDRILFYREYIEKELQNEKSVQIICPTVFDVKKITNELKEIFNKKLYSFHGETTKKRITEGYKSIQETTSLIISTANFLDIPAKNKSTVILEKDSSSYYRTVISPFIDLRLFTEEYAKISKLKLIVSDSVLRLERFDNIQITKDIDMNIFLPEKISLINSLNKNKLKETDSERIRSLNIKKEFSPFSKKILEEIKNSLQKKEKIFLYTQRKNLAPKIICNNCGNIVRDIKTDIPYSLYKDEKNYFYINNVTGEIIPAFDTCQFCGSWRLQSIGIGTQTIKEEIEKEIPEIKNKIHIIDSSHIKNKTELKKVLSSFYNAKNTPKILIGTQKAIPYLNDIDTSYIVSLDGIFYRQSYTNEERALIMIKRIYDHSKRTFIQTRIAGNIHNKKNLNINKKKKENDVDDPLKIKFSKRLDIILHKIKHFTEIQKHMTSKYTESLKIWDLIKTGDYLSYLKGTQKNNYLTIKINHSIEDNNYIDLLKIYKNKFKDFNYLIKKKAHTRKNFSILSIVLFIKKDLWSQEFQDENLYQKLPANDRNIEVIINPDVFL